MNEMKLAALPEITPIERVPDVAQLSRETEDELACGLGISVGAVWDGSYKTNLREEQDEWALRMELDRL